MKNKHLKTALTAIMMIGIFTALVMMVFDMLESQEGWFYTTEVHIAGTEEEPIILQKLVMDWQYAAIFLTMILLAFVAWLSKLCMFTIPALRNGEDNAKSCLILNIFIGLGLVFAIIALFLPLNCEGLMTNSAKVVVVGEEVEMPASLWDADRVVAGTILSWLGMPMAFIAAATKGFLALKNK